MKAWVLHEVGDIRLETAERPQPQPGEVLVAVKAAGVCGSDIPRIYQTGAHKAPLIPGHEFSGVVEELGKGVSEEWLGKRVGVFPLIPCKNCAPCQKKQYELCKQYDYLGSRRDGGFAEYAAVQAWNLLELPEGVSYEEAAMLEPMAVAVHAMRRAGALEGKSVAVCGLGTIGLLLLMFLLDAGRRGEAAGPGRPEGEKRIFAVGNKELQRETAMRLGLSEENFCDSRTMDAKDWLFERTCGAGADVFFECVGKNETIKQAIRGTAASGRVVLVGNPNSDMSLERDVYWKILRNQLLVTGTWNSSFRHSPEDDWQYALKRIANKQIRPAGLITHSLRMEELEHGLHIMRDKTEAYLKVMGRF
ncbi:MAG: galactitol-1-phosphate 5-dehydrogenase [Lachnospiraceae bacterium]|nr:galactitol-1-phosphate 5-dehydrogenase [Lachnospiraceae bacterium]